MLDTKTQNPRDCGPANAVRAAGRIEKTRFGLGDLALTHAVSLRAAG